MNNLTSIIQLIATAVSTRMTMTLSQRISQMSLSMNRNSSGGWVDRTRAGQAIQARKIERSGSAVAQATQEYDQSRQNAQTAAGEFLQEQITPTGKNLAALAKAAGDYREKMEEAGRQLARVTAEHAKMKADSISAADGRKVERAGRAVERATSKRDEASSKYSAMRNAVTEEVTNPTGMDPKVLLKMAIAADRYKEQLDRATLVLNRATNEQDKLQKSIDARLRAGLKSRAQEAAEGRQPQTAWQSRKRAIKVRFKRAVRKALNPITSRYRKLRDTFDPKKAFQRRNAARASFKSAQGLHALAKEVHGKNPTATTAANVAKTGQAVEAAGAELRTAEGIAAVTEAFAGLSEALPIVGTVIAAVATAIAAAYGFVQKTLASGKAEVERFRGERSRFSGAVANAIARYDNQSRQLEARSSRATSGSSRGVVESTMSLREELQDLNQIVETLGNEILKTCLDLSVIVVQISKATLDEDSWLRWISPIPGFLDLIVGHAKKIEKNTAKDAPNPGVQLIQGIMEGNDRKRNDKKFPPLPPLK